MASVRWLLLLAAVLAGAQAAGAKTVPFAASVSTVNAKDLPFSYRPGCPVPPSQLRLLRLGYWGFDGKPHRGSLVVNAAATGDVERVFARLFAERFPIRRMEPIDAFEGDDNRSMGADNTSAFNCRYAVAAGPRRWSAHAYGEAIDINPVENPYLEGGRVLPTEGRRYLERSNVRPGMAVKGGRLVTAFAGEGWLWGGRWTGSPDPQHFSATGG
jgi:hypothetical protein